MRTQIKGFAQWLNESQLQKAPITPPDKKEMKSFLYNHFMHDPELRDHFELGPHEDHDSLMSKISHEVHAHIDPTGHVSFEVPLLKHRLSSTFGLSYGGAHGDSHASGHGETPRAEDWGTNHAKFDVGVKIPLSTIFGK